jgi:hypothetical protein
MEMVELNLLGVRMTHTLTHSENMRSYKDLNPMVNLMNKLDLKHHYIVSCKIKQRKKFK